MTEGDVPRHSELVKLNEVGDGAEPLEELDGCLEVLGVQLDEGSGGEYHPGAHHRPHHHQQQQQHHHQQRSPPSLVFFIIIIIIIIINIIMNNKSGSNKKYQQD